MQRRLERRMRVKRNDQVKEGEGKMNPQTAQQLGISSQFEVVVAGKRKLLLKVVPAADVPAGEVWANPEEMASAGVADNSIATIRASS